MVPNWQEENAQLYLGDCLDIMPSIPNKSIDAIIADLPYGTTACKWDTVIPFELLWEQYKRIIKPRGAVVLFGSQPFTSALVMSNLQWFKYCWVWDKITARGHLVAKKRPMAQHEDISVFYGKAPSYNPQMTLKKKPEVGKSVEASRTSLIGGRTTKKSQQVIRTHSYPKTILRFGMDKRVGHPTQKPTALLEYLIRTYTNEGETVLDNTMGSGTTGVACVSLDRSFMGIEKGSHYFEVAQERIQQAQDLRKSRLF